MNTIIVTITLAVRVCCYGRTKTFQSLKEVRKVDMEVENQHKLFNKITFSILQTRQNLYFLVEAQNRLVMTILISCFLLCLARVIAITSV